MDRYQVDSDEDVKTRMAMGFTTFQRLNTIWRGKQLHSISRSGCKSLALAKALYGSETRKDTAAVNGPISYQVPARHTGFQLRGQSNPNKKFIEEWKKTPPSNKIFAKFTPFAGRVLRLPPESPTQPSALHWTVDTRRKEKNRETEDLKKDLTAMGVSLTNGISTAEDISL